MTLQEPVLLPKEVSQETLKQRFETANKRIFHVYKVEQAFSVLETANKMFNGNLALAFSGGKDSLAVLDITLKVNPDIPVMFSSTTVQCPETIQYVKALQQKWGFNLQITRCKVPFFKAVKKKGWATHEDRWCCKPYKEQPAFEFLAENEIHAEITGTVRTESIYRRSLKAFRMPKKSPFLIRINPIYDWNQWEVWDYIRENNLPYNPLYDKGYRRIGCWCCPLNGPSHYRRLKKTHPKLFHFLERFEPAHPYFVNIK